LDASSASRRRRVGRIDDQLQLDVVRVAKDKDGGTRDRVGGSDRGVNDAKAASQRVATVQLVPVGHGERQMIQADTGPSNTP
jgi:hypothetical protein